LEMSKEEAPNTSLVDQQEGGRNTSSVDQQEEGLSMSLWSRQEEEPDLMRWLHSDALSISINVCRLSGLYHFQSGIIELGEALPAH
jgi:hypothetical protein